jgi:hypothetical protein
LNFNDNIKKSYGKEENSDIIGKYSPNHFKPNKNNSEALYSNFVENDNTCDEKTIVVYGEENNKINFKSII